MTIPPPPTAPSGTPLRATLEAAFRLARFDRTALPLFDASVAGFWQSYRAAFLIAPIELGLVVARTSEGQDWLMPLVIEALIFAIRWMLLPLILLIIADRIGRQDRALRFMVAYNWVSVPQAAVTLIGLGLGITAGVQPMAAFLLIYGSVAYALVLGWFVVRVGLDVPNRIAIAIVGIDLSLNFALETLATIILHEPIV